MSISSFQIATASITIFHLTDMNTLVLDKKGSIHFSNERNPIPDFLVDLQQKDFTILQAKAGQHVNQCCMYTNEFGLSYLAYLFHNDENHTKLFISGPFLRQTPDIQQLILKFKFDQQKQMVIEEFLNGLKIVSHSRIQSISNMIYLVNSIEQAPIYTIETSHEELDEPVTKTAQQSDKKHVELIELRYALEKEWMKAIEIGDISRFKNGFLKQGNLFDFAYRFPNQPVRAMKNMLIIINTIFRLAAEKGKVHPFFLHHLSEKFSIKIEQITSIDYLNKLVSKMCEEYCDLVNERSMSEHTLLIQKAIHFLTIHFNQPLDLKNLAQYCLVHPAHLSRQFKKETGMTLTDYLNNIRIKEAKILLRKDRTSIEWIAESVGFDNAGYFTRIFKKVTGVTPTNYRNTLDLS